MKYLAAKSLLSKRVLNSLIIIATVVISGNYSQDVLAQITPDDSLGTESSVMTPDVEIKGETADRIDGGAIRESNLFHSFQEFNVREGQSVYFSSPERIENIFTRVTGNNPSNILGTLGVDGAANLLLLNPNGILFGENSSLDIEGSFFGTTAESLLFRDGAKFSAVEPQSSLLTISVPLGLQFGSNPGNILVQSSLEVPNGQNFSLVGGELNFEGSGTVEIDGVNQSENSVTAPGGRVELGGLSASGIVGIEENGSLNFPPEINKADITSKNFIVSVSAGGGGTIIINAKNLDIVNSSLAAGIDPDVKLIEAQAGDIVINASEKVTIQGSDSTISFITNLTGDFSNLNLTEQNVPAINNRGNAGNIIINAKSLEANGSFFIGSFTNGEGDAGDTKITATEKVSLVGEGETGGNIIGIAFPFAIGKGADIVITTSSITLDNIGVSTSTLGQGNVGNIVFKATEFVSIRDSSLTAETYSAGNGGKISIEAEGANIFLDKETTISTLVSPAVRGEDRFNLPGFSFIGTGKGGDIVIRGRTLSLTQDALITTATGGEGDGGNIIIDLEKLIIEDGVIGTGTGGVGKAGNLNVTASDFVQLSKANINLNDEIIFSGLATNTTSSSAAGNINIKVGRLTVTNGAQITANTSDTGNGGDIDIISDSLIVEHGGQISTDALGTTGKAGNLTVSSNAIVQLTGSSTRLSSSTAADNAPAGNMSIETEQLIINEGAQIFAITTGDGNGGDINIQASSIEILGTTINFPSGIFAVSSGISQENNQIIPGSGDGGTITITTDNLNIQDQAQISAFSLGEGKAGRISLVANDSLEANNGRIISNSFQSSGGDINITAGNIRLKGNSNIFTNVEEGIGGGGNIMLTADSVVAFDDSDIFAFSSDGVGGNITINSPVLFVNGFSADNRNANPESLEGNNRVDINATGAVSGSIDIPDVNFLSDSLAELSENALDTEELVANSCVVRDRPSSGTFIITGKGGLPVCPGNWAVSTYSTGDVRTIPNKTKTTSTNNNWRSGDPIVEPQGIYRLSNGKLVLSRECSSTQ